MNWWHNLPERARVVILIAWPVLAVAGFGWLAWRDLAVLGKDPALNSVSFLQRGGANSQYAVLEKTNEQIKAEEAVAARRPQAEQRLAEIQEKQGILLERLPTKRQKETMRKRIQEMVNEVNDSEFCSAEFVGCTIVEPVVADTAKRGRRSGADMYEEIVYRCRLTGDMNGLIFYIHKVESNPRFMSIRSVDIRPGPVTLDTEAQVLDYDLHSATLEIVTYVLQDESDV